MHYGKHDELVVTTNVTFNLPLQLLLSRTVGEFYNEFSVLISCALYLKDMSNCETTAYVSQVVDLLKASAGMPLFRMVYVQSCHHVPLMGY